LFLLLFLFLLLLFLLLGGAMSFFGGVASFTGSTAASTSRPSRQQQSYLGFCMGPKESVSTVVKQSSSGLWLCGAQAPCGRAEPDSEFRVLQLPRCGQCNVPDVDPAIETEISFSCEARSQSLGYDRASQRNLETAKVVIRDIYSEMERHCIDERKEHEKTGIPPTRQKQNVWATYTNKARLQKFANDSLAFVQQNADCRSRVMTVKQLRFLVLLQHFVSEDSSDFNRSELLRKHQDAFEGVLTDGVNSQLVKDAHRSEFSIDGSAFSMQDLPAQVEGMEADRGQAIAEFQTEFVTVLERYILAFASRKKLSKGGSKRLLQSVTTQMSQAGLANLERGSQASRYFVGSLGLDQRTAYNLSTMQTLEGEMLKLSILCMKTGFSQYLDKDRLLKMSVVECPKQCKPESYLYQYATLSFSVGPQVDDCESILCTVLDALDEANISAVHENDEEILVEEHEPCVT